MHNETNTPSQPNIPYRYFFYGWLFRDASTGTIWERCAARTHNREQSRWLPTYMARWSVAGIALFGVAAFIEGVLHAPQLSAFFYVPSIMAVPFNVTTCVCWVGLRTEIEA